MYLDITNPSDMHTLSPYTQHLTQLTYRGKSSKTPESFLNGIPIVYPMLEDFDVLCHVEHDELLCLVNVLPKLGNFAKLKLTFHVELLEDAKSVSVLNCLQSCSFLTEFCCSARYRSVTSSSIEALLLNKFKVITLESMAFDSSAVEALSRSLQSQYCSLVTLTLHNCYLFTFSEFKQLAIGIGRNISLHRLVFSKCELNSAALKVLADALRDNKTLKEVVISKQHTGSGFNKAVIQAMKQCNQNIDFKVS